MRTAMRLLGLATVTGLLTGPRILVTDAASGIGAAAVEGAQETVRAGHLVKGVCVDIEQPGGPPGG
jgi:hypothetical protein